MNLEIKGIIEEIVFRNEENSYTVAVLNVNASDEEYLYIKGIIPFISEGEMIKIVGILKNHPTYGEQIEVISSEMIQPETDDEILSYLSSGRIKGIGPSLAKRIVKKFSKDTFDIMKYNPEKLKEIQGIGKKKLVEIIESFSEDSSSREVIIYLQKLGISNVIANKIYKEYGDNTIKIVNENPYRLADEIKGLGFKQADIIAKNMGISNESLYRIHTGIKYALNLVVRKGHIFAYEDELIEIATEILNVDRELIKVELKELVIKGELYFDKVDEKTAIYFPLYYNAEIKVAQKLFKLSVSEFKKIKMNVDDEILNMESEYEIEFDEKQKKAIYKALTGGVTVITGGPGTGKTTIINAIISFFEREEFLVKLAAPTGRAAKKMSEATNREAKTIHRLLEYTYSIDEKELVGFNRNSDNPLYADVIVIDEMSMVDILLMSSLLDAIEEGTRLILVGDSNQLPSVGAGIVLKDIIESNMEFIDVIELDKIFRQANESMIVVNAHRINEGKKPYLNEKNKDFFFIRKREHKNIVSNIVDLCTHRLPNYYELNSVNDIQVLSVVKGSSIGTKNLNVELQRSLNPSSKLKNEKQIGDRIFREGDKVMQIKNNYNVKWTDHSGKEGEGVFNGDIGYIKRIDLIKKNIEIEFDNERIVKYDFSSLDEIMHAYAITVHKSQGSEFDAVVMPISYASKMLMTRNVLYTAITRAKKLVVLVGEEKYLNSMIENNFNIQRNTSLKEKFIKIMEIWVDK